MTLEQSLESKVIFTLLVSGHSKQTAINAAANRLKSQGFSADYSKQIAQQMADLF
jgi:mannitol/fructose-specific phosphotransferase system IIA component (Ntr-type)